MLGSLALAGAVSCGGRTLDTDSAGGECPVKQRCNDETSSPPTSAPMPASEPRGPMAPPPWVPPFGSDAPARPDEPAPAAPAELPGEPAPEPVDNPGELPLATDLTLLPLIPGARTLVSDPRRERFYTVVESTAPEHPNELVTVDAATGAQLASVAIGAEPDVLAISDDGSTLWVGLRGENAVRRVDLLGEAPVPAEAFSMPVTALGEPTIAADLVVVPGTTSTLGVAFRVLGLADFEGVLLIDDGVARPLVAPGGGKSLRLSVGPAGHLLGAGGRPEAFQSLAISPEGLTVTRHPGLISAPAADVIYGEGYVFATSGDVLDVRDAAAPFRMGALPKAGLVAPELTAARIWVLAEGTVSGVSTVELHELAFPSLGVLDSRIVGTGVRLLWDVARTPAGALAFIGDPAPVSGASLVPRPQLYLLQ